MSWFFYAQGMSTPPLGMMNVADHLSRELLEVITIDGQLDYEPPEDTLERVTQYAPRVVAVMPAPVLHLYTFMANTAFPYHLAFLRILKKRLPEVKTVLGGLLPRQKAGFVLSKENSVDIVILSSHPIEAAGSISALAKGEEPGKIPGIAFRDKSDAPMINEKTTGGSTQLDAAPDLTLQKEYNAADYGIDKSLYLRENREIYPVYPVISMLGCPFDCTFCATPLHFPDSVKALSPGQFSSNIECAVNTHNVTAFSFWDDTFTRNPAWVTGVCNHIINLGLDIQWWCFGKVEWVLKNRAILPLMRRAGCSMMWLGVESADEADLTVYKKGIRFPMALEAVDALRLEGILPTTSFILGNVNDNEEKTLKIVALSSELEARGAVNIYTLLVPVPGTQLYKNVQRAKLLKSTDLRLFNGTRALLEYPGMPGDRLEEIFYDSYKNSVLNERFMQNTGRTNFNIDDTAAAGMNTLRHGFEKEKMRMLALEESGYLDDDPQSIAASCQWIFDE
ncbi:MAG: hypothetical protein GY950_28645 [bacterium]|nr:hypothetical protein [bacterium]